MKKTDLFLLAATFAALLAVGCHSGSNTSSGGNKEDPPKFDLAAMKKVIEEKNGQFTRAHVTGDRTTIDGMFTQDAKVLPPGADPVVGRAAIDALTAQYLEYGVAEFREETTDFYGNADMLIDQGNYVLVYGKDNAMEKGKYLNVCEEGGRRLEDLFEHLEHQCSRLSRQMRVGATC